MTDNSDIAEAFLNLHDPKGWFRSTTFEGPCQAIDLQRLSELTDLVQDLIANIVAQIIDAGSERDSVNESEQLREALLTELSGWAT